VARISAVTDVAAPASRTWQLVTDWPAHGRWVPLTTVSVLGGGDGRGLGTRIVGRTVLGPIGFDDPMVVTAFVAPAGDEVGDTAGRCDVDKLGGVVRGTAWFEVQPLGPTRCRITWGEDVEIAPRALTRLLRPLVEAGGRQGLRSVLRSFARDAARG
jgi:Polyketide cyclase / dehydrase and lipid transport